jgi:hypothetical protein
MAKRGNTDLLKQYDRCKRCRHKALMGTTGLAKKYRIEDQVFCGKIKKYFDKKALKDASIFCDG